MSNANERPRLLIIGIGNEFRSDDAAGIFLARRLFQRLPPDVAVIEESGEGTALLEAWRDVPSVLLVDAVHSGAAPGTLHRLDLREREASPEFFRTSTHAFGVVQAVELARALGRLPACLILYGVEGKQFTSGEGLSPEVEHALSVALERILEEVNKRLAQSGE